MLALLSVIAFTIAALAAPAGGSPVLAVTDGSTTTTSVGPNPTEVTINSIAYGGSGCPEDSVGSYISSDGTTFTLIFDNMVASIGSGIPITENRKNCQLNINLQYPSGFQYSILSTDFRGYAGLWTNVTGVQQATYYFSGSSSQATASTKFYAPTDGDYEITDNIPFTSTVFSPCGASLPLNIDSQVRLIATGVNASGQLTEDSVDGKVTFVVGVQWQTCTA